MATVYLGLGSNLADRAQNIYAALQRLKAKAQLDRISSLYETEPVGLADQPWFLNLACGGDTDLSPQALLRLAKTIEREMGRKKGLRFGPRMIDIDILFYDDLVISTPELEIPHPRLHERGFTLIPLDEIAPDLVHPLLGMTIRELRDSAASLETVHLYTVKDERASD
jgi:2-amino-4-hydroxy-6-hydroxymethyldihydropteridine diphosphokinase